MSNAAALLDPTQQSTRELIQRWVGAPVSGSLDDPATVLELLEDVNGLNDYLIKKSPKQKPADKPTALPKVVDRSDKFVRFPKPDFHSMKAYYGAPGDKSNIVTIEFPYKMRLYNRKSPANYVKNWGCHKKVHDSLRAVLQDILKTFGRKWITEHGLDVFGGIFNDRNVRNGTSKSKHSWGAAIDLNPLENKNRQIWQANKVGVPGYGTMPVEAVLIFEAHGWKHGGRAWKRDGMHFQATQ